MIVILDSGVHVIEQRAHAMRPYSQGFERS
jgi:hypothetical protein